MPKITYIVVLVTLTLVLPTAATAGVFYNNPGAAGLEHPKAAMTGAWLVRVKPGEKASFYDNVVKAGCPSLTPACRRRGYLLPGDVAVAAYATGPFTVVEFVGLKGAVSDGAIETRLLERIETPKPSPQDWIGHWQSGDEQDITISRTPDPSVLSLTGAASWGGHDPERVKRGGVNLGDFSAYMKPVGAWGGFIAGLEDDIDPKHRAPAISGQKGLNTDWTRYFPAEASNDDYECRASFRLLGPYLLAYTPL